MAISREPRFIPVIWGPYFSAMVPGWWLTEGGQSATGALLDHVIATHTEGAALSREAAASKTHVAALLNARLEGLAKDARLPFPAALTRELHVLPDHHGNRSPRADPSLRGMVSGLKLTEGPDALALFYLATVQALALGTRHILESMREHGYRVDTLVATGGDAKNPVFLREHADATGCRVVLPREPEAVLLGSAMLGAVASGDRASIAEAMGAMSAADRVIEPAGGSEHPPFLRRKVTPVFLQDARRSARVPSPHAVGGARLRRRSLMKRRSFLLSLASLAAQSGSLGCKRGASSEGSAAQARK